MNNHCHGNQDDIKAFQLLSEVADEQPVSQRELAKRLGIALGLVNSYIKNFIAKGYIRIKNYPHNRYAYLLTPQGLAEKGRLAYQHVHYFTNLYTVTRQDYLQLFQKLADRNITRISFCGVDEVAEIAWLSLQEAGLELNEVMDDCSIDSQFMGRRVIDLRRGIQAGGCPIVITSLKRAQQLKIQLHDLGASDETIICPNFGAKPSETGNYSGEKLQHG
ncbi:winged helix-turn-helix transcriptional regulator [Pelotalea chapellei]|uniref:Winged helix-turn-helix transcriptional regulator n=1 Tax=Pelotalea chapellei TaxID=44671 RepID=A0ABS5UA27_9BACT|nr:winged helix-turn-helix transcriptional regulator [Pelotalea chapellei]MBT1072536.1 winged helix-turn-helix transcriptional regulator [Pelotalea chapellei]